MSSKKADQLAEKFGATLASTVAIRPPSAPSPAAALADEGRYEGVVRARNFVEVPLDLIVADESQPREHFDEAEITRLAESIRRHGQLAPIRVRQSDDGTRWVVLVGGRRLRACRLAGLERIRVELVERPMTESDILAEQVVENVVRADLRPVEEGKAYRRLLDLHGSGVEALAESLGLEPTTIHHRLGLLRLPEEVAEQVDGGAIRATAAYEISKLPDPEAQRALADRVVAEGLDFKDTQAEVRRLRAPGRSASAPKGRGDARRSRAQVFLTSSGCRVTVESRDGLDPERVRDALRESILILTESETDPTGG